MIHHGSLAFTFIAFLKGMLGWDVGLIAALDPTLTSVAIDTTAHVTYVGTILYGVSSMSIRIAMVFFYWRLFPTRVVRWGCITLGVISVAWLVIVEIITVYICHPVVLAGTTQGQLCYPDSTTFVISGALNSAIDAMTVALPIHDVLRLQLPKKRKYIICGVFLIGGMFVLATNKCRLHVTDRKT